MMTEVDRWLGWALVAIFAITGTGLIVIAALLNPPCFALPVAALVGWFTYQFVWLARE